MIKVGSGFKYKHKGINIPIALIKFQASQHLLVAC